MHLLIHQNYTQIAFPPVLSYIAFPKYHGTNIPSQKYVFPLHVVEFNPSINQNDKILIGGRLDDCRQWVSVHHLSQERLIAKTHLGNCESKIMKNISMRQLNGNLDKLTHQ